MLSDPRAQPPLPGADTVIRALLKSFSAEHTHNQAKPRRSTYVIPTFTPPTLALLRVLQIEDTVTGLPDESRAMWLG